MKFELLIKEGAQADISNGFQHYSQISPKLGDDFVEQLDAAFERILSNPDAFAKVFKEVRQMRIRRFPYVVSFLVEENRIVVLAVLHGHRKPEIWKKRS